MKSNQTCRSSWFTIHTLLLFGIILGSVPVAAEDIPGSVIGRYDDWELENTPTVGMGLFPSVELDEDDDNDSLSLPGKTSSSTGTWVTISPFSATLTGQETNLIAGYLSGNRNGATITIAGKKGSDTEFSDITTIQPDENGLFVWAVPASKNDIDLFRVTARAGSTRVLSNAIRFTEEAEGPIVKPVVSAVRTVVPMVDESESSGYGQSRLSISASDTTPAVGEDVTITGRLTDQNGKGIGGATVSIDETGYPGAARAEPFDSTQTGADGRFTFTISVSFANSVGLVAHYDGDESHSSADSNTITFSSHE